MIPKNHLQHLREKISFMLGNQLCYPKTLLSLARSRPLKEEEIQKAIRCLEACRQLADAEFIVFMHYQE